MVDNDIIMDIEMVTKRAISGVVTFTLRTFFIQIFSLIATFILTVLLDPSAFGIFFVVSAILNLFVYFSDIGLAAALIQKKEEPSNTDLATTFTIQQIIIATLVTVGLLFSSQIGSFYNLDDKGIFLLRVLIFSLILSSLKTIPSILLERKLRFGRLVVPQIFENIVFYSVAIVLAYLHFGVASFAWAVLARGATGLALIYILSPWMPRVGFNKIIAKKLSTFGVPFQINSVLALLKDDLLIVFLGKYLPFSHLGYIGWSQKWAFLPLRFFMDNVNRVTFPAYSRLQHEQEKLGHAIEKSLFFVTYFVYPSVFGMAAIAPKLMEVIPNYTKWQPALPLLYLFAINSVFSAVSTTFTNTLFALGRPKIVLYFMVFWTSATWVLTFPLVIRFGYIGVGIASALVSVSSIATVYFVKKQIRLKIAKSVIGPLLISILMFLSIKTLQTIFSQTLSDLILTIIIGGLIYLCASFAIFRKRLIEDAMIIINSMIFKK